MCGTSVFIPAGGVVAVARCYLQQTCSHHESVKKSDDRHDTCNEYDINMVDAHTLPFVSAATPSGTAE